MTVINKTNKNYKRSQRGRSMVEMLGVLAIVGVLSVGGISAYSTAMEKHKANEALHKASLMATTVSAYAMTNNGKLPSSITDIPNSEYTTTLSDNGTQFNLKLSGIAKDVCTQMQNSKGGMVREVVCDESGNATITYYKNLATTEAEGKKSPTGDGDCAKNSDCKDAEGNVDTTKYCKFSGGDCAGPTGGTCTDKERLTPYTLNLPGGALTVYKSSGTRSWWSASNLCQAHGKQMVTMADLGIADSGTNTSCYFDSSNSNYKDYPCICNGGSDSDCSATKAAIRTNTGALGTSGGLWLADNSKSSSCYARRVGLSYGQVYRDSRDTRRYALCR